ncbi:Pentatricopeptide repeat-containing protein [Abeliophyllum distichum]|uniref:Pentatricopeptide repeat-containing protein n=1 Tax=Abeliophyllum distichum TaxID=126358 RepID=A0ABD1ST61_9LAMI
MVKTGLDNTPFPLSKLLAHTSIQDIQYAASIFKNVQSPNLYMFNTMLRGYSISDDPKRAIFLFNCMRAQKQSQEFLLDEFTFVSVLKSSTRLFTIWTGFGIHSVVLKCGFDLFLNVKNTLLYFYCVCGQIKEAHQLFDECCAKRDLVSWNTLMGGYLGVFQYDVVVDLFRKLHWDGYRTSVTTILNMLSAVGEMRNVLIGECLHGICIKIGFLMDPRVVTALISMYGKHGDIDFARRIFDEIDIQKDVVMWNCLIDGYAKNGLLEEALELLGLMKCEKARPNSSTLAGLLSACASSGALTVGQSIHDYLEKQQLALDVVLGTALVDMYAKSGLLGKAVDIFDRMESKDVKCWTAMILGHGVHGQANYAITLLHRMEEEGFRPNKVTFLAVLSSCSHGGLVTEGVIYFRRMVEMYSLMPEVEHYGCIIDLLGRAGLLEDAYELIKGLPNEGDATAWRALLAACRVYGNVDLGERVKRELEKICDGHPADSLVLTGAYAMAGWTPYTPSTLEKKVNLAKEVDCKQFGTKEAGCSTIELNIKRLEVGTGLETMDLV